MARKALACVFFLSLVFMAAEALAGPDVKEGLWEYTVETQIPGMAMKMGPQKHTYCLTKDNLVPQASEPGSKCKTVSQKVKGDTVTWKVECQTDQGKAVMDGTITYKGDTFNGVSKFSQAGMQMEQKLSGKRLGPCR
ncbi:MAG: DUF3617 family protein [bacterium]